MSLGDADQPTSAEKQNPILKLVLEIGPLLVFFFGNLRGEWLMKTFPVLDGLGGPIFVATALFMAATAISLIVSRLVFGHLPIMPFVSGIVVLVFGGIGIYLHNDTFIKMKPTIVNCLFGLALLGGLAFGRSLLGIVFNAAFQLDPEGWRKLTLRWGIFFIFLAILNEIIWRNFSNDFWVNFKVWGTMPLTLLFTMSQMPLIIKHSVDKTDETPKA